MLPTITVQADVAPRPSGADRLQEENAEAIDALRAKLPPGVTGIVRRRHGGGQRQRAQRLDRRPDSPLMLLLTLIVLMIQLQSFQRLFLVLSVAPLGLIGVVAIMLATNTPMGFVATLGIVALAGMIIRNSVILVHQIDGDNRSEGENRPGRPWSRPPTQPAAADHADRRRRDPGHKHMKRGVLGQLMAFAVAGGLVGRDPADHALPACALCRLVPHQGAGNGAARGSRRADARASAR